MRDPSFRNIAMPNILEMLPDNSSLTLCFIRIYYVLILFEIIINKFNFMLDNLMDKFYKFQISKII